ncbi:hypothetical protein BsWGS_13199 [Bradybaena similaris]
MEIGLQNIRTSVTEYELKDENDLAELDRSEHEVIVQDGGSEAVKDITNRELSMFGGLCDGVLSSLALVQGALQEMLEFKDKMLKHDLPPPLMVHLALITGRLFRSISDLGLPIGELVRLVRIYSVSWEENNVALKKLSESFDSKQMQLNIAIRRLQLFDEQSKRMAREKRILNWERLFAKVTTAKSHGRRWKFNIETIKETAKLGLEHIQAYALKVSNSNEEDPNLEDSEVSGYQVSLHDLSGGEDKKKELESVNSEEADDLNNVESIVLPELQVPTVPVKEAIILQSEKITRCDEHSDKPEVPRPSTQDAETWTHEPEFDHSLFVRVFCPEGLQQTGLKCSLTYNGKVLKTPILDMSDEKTHEVNEQLIDRPHAAEQLKNRSQHSVFHSTQDLVSAQRTRFCELEIQLPTPLKEGVSLLGKRPAPESETLNVAVHQGRFEEIIALTSIHLKDIKQMSLETCYLPSLHEDVDVPEPHSRAESFNIASSWDGDSLADSIDLPGLADDLPVHVTGTSSYEKLITNSEPQLFSLYSLHAGKSGEAQMPCGSIPLLMFWGKRVRPWYSNKQCGTCSVNDLVYAMTGIDITTASSEDLHKQMVDAAISVSSLHTEAEEETVARSDVDQMLQQHQTEIASLHQEYDLRVAELTELISNLQAQQGVNLQDHETKTHQPHPVSTSPKMSTRLGTKTPVTSHTEYSGTSPCENSPLPVTAHRMQSGNKDEMIEESMGRHVSLNSSASKHRPHPPRTQKSLKNFKVGHSLPRWGENLPPDFYERLRLWEEESKHHKQELSERTLKEVKDNLERKLAGQHKLSKQEKHIFDALQDVSLPALFMPYKMGNVYNPRAHHYFHPTGSTDVRLTQPPSVFQLPAVTNHKLSAVNLFQVSKNFQIQGPPWLLEHYTENLQPSQNGCVATAAPLSRLTQISTSEQASLSGNLDS